MAIKSEDSKNKVCPFSFGTDSGLPKRCYGDGCMAWKVVHPAASREDHSGGSSAISELASKTGRIAYRTGGFGSSGRWNLDAVGECGRVK